MKRASWYLVIPVLLVSLALAAGCTREKPSGRPPAPMAQANAATATLVLVVSPLPIDVLPTLTPTLRATRIAVPPTATPERGFAELIAPTSTPTPTATPTEMVTPALAVAEAEPFPTPVPVLTPALETFPLQPIDLASPTPLPVVTIVPAAPPAPSGTTYVVRWGDTLFSIAAQFGVTVEALKSANGLSSDIIRVGQQLIIPTASAPSAPAPGGATTIHIVQPGETLFRIALRYNTTVEAIAQANGISNPWYIYPGQQLTVPLGPTGNVPPAPRRTYV
ncbi:MAG: LysM peptidoglycan-binding domain-containing protein, partial [Anaerolineae bacterium]|nr:LysM peptidoglycan-binding domain-containing protein [Anaerolineae bacterium]MDW8070802.1 LysM peptidoglycan-binding domain-containing protein [Anaerolineae bacterium]